MGIIIETPGIRFSQGGPLFKTDRAKIHEWIKRKTEFKEFIDTEVEVLLVSLTTKTARVGQKCR
jgi:hypothetical protein